MSLKGAQRLSASQRSACRRRPPRGSPNRVLNAFRHHRVRHDPCPAPLRSSGCAQRLSASQRSAFDAATPVARVLDVLNAFRHHRGRHVRWAGRRAFTECSTPFGITESAWQTFRHGVVLELRCSTPFGITEVGIGNGERSSGRAALMLNAFRHHRGRHRNAAMIPDDRGKEVLNAFRHHRGRHPFPIFSASFRSQCSTPFGITEVGIFIAHRSYRPFSMCAQRLSASQRSACAPEQNDAPEFLAQRLSASQRSAYPDESQDAPAMQQVLNAFRHHRGRHPAHITRVSLQRLTVLNAFRHHRGGHPTGFRRTVDRGRCSTPFGITEVGMIRQRLAKKAVGD